MNKTHIALKSTLLAAALLSLAACDRGTNETTASNSGTTESRPSDTMTPSNPGGLPGTMNPASAPGAMPPTTSNSPTTSADAATQPATTPGGMAPPEQTINDNPTAAGSTGTAPSTQALAAADRTFVEKAAGAGLYEVAIARLAADKATDPAVKSYASMLVEHHTAANDKLKQIVGTRDATLPTSPPADKQKVIDKMSKLEAGAAFDREFINTVGIKDHTADIALFEKASREAQDADVKTFATTTLPTLREHLSAAKKLPAKKG